MKDVLKVLSMYFALGFGTVAGVGAGMKVCDILLSTKSKDQKEDATIKVAKESE